MPLEVVVIISPKLGKEERCKELVKWATEEAHKAEPDTSSYHAFSTAGDNEGETDYIVRMRVKDEEALVKRRELKHHQHIIDSIQKEDLLRRPMRYMKLKDLGGWDR